MYRPFFGLNDLPFRTTPDLDYFYSDASRGDIVEAIGYSLERGDGIVKVVGEVGSGKTTILRRLAEVLPDKYFIIYINSPNLQPHDILLFICHEFGIDISEPTQKFILINKLRDFFICQHSLGRQCVIMIDEAQAMPIETLEEIRLLLNLETDQHKLVQILLFGQPELDSNLAKPEIRQFLSRINHSIAIPQFKPDDIQSYLNFRMRKAGYQGKDVFNNTVSKLIAKRSKGIVRSIHNLADAALMAAYADGSYQLKPSHIGRQSPSVKYYVISVVLVLLFIALFVGYYLVYTKQNPSSLISSIYVKELATKSGSVETIDKSMQVASHVNTSHVNNRVVHTELEQVELALEIVADSPRIELMDIQMLDRERSEDIDALKKLYKELSTKKDFQFTIQVITGGVSDLERVRSDLNRIVSSDDVFWIIDRPRYTMFLGFYSDYRQAQESIKMLPESYRIGNPIIIRSERVLTRLDRLLSTLEAE